MRQKAGQAGATSEEEIQVIARIIYEQVFLPGQEDSDREPMPTFDVAREEEIGAYARALAAAWALAAANAVARPIQRQEPDSPLGEDPQPKCRGPGGR